MATVGAKLKAARQAHQMTQQEVADCLHLTRQTISGWETGRTYPDVESLIKLADMFNLSLDTLLREDDQFVMNLTKQAKGMKAARQSYHAIQAVSLILLVMTIGSLLRLPGMILPPLSLSFLIIVTSLATIVNQHLTREYWRLVQPRVIDLRIRLAIVGLLWLTFAAVFGRLNGWGTDTWVMIGSGTLVFLIATVHALRHPEENRPHRN